MLKISRNDLCLCGSGKKYKKCCFLNPEKDYEIKRAFNFSSTLEGAKKVFNEPIKKYTIKVQLTEHWLHDVSNEISRTFVVSGKETLYDLHLKIQDAFCWDNDHMFSFYLSNELYDSETEYSAAPDGEHYVSRLGKPTKSASTAEIRDLGFEEGRQILYLFDYGDLLVHQVTIIGVEVCESSSRIPFKLVEKIGEDLDQYGLSDDV